VQRERQKVAVVSVSKKTPESVVNALSATKIQVTEAFDTIANRIVTELGSLKEIQTAIEAERENLENLYGITAEANSLQNLLSAHQQETETFNRSRDEQRAKWEEEKKQAQKDRKWEEEQYSYETRKRRAAEKDAWEEELKAEREGFAKECADRIEEIVAREKAVFESENEVRTLREQAAKAEETLKAETTKAVAVATNALKKDLTHEHTVKTLELQNTLNLKNSEISQLQTRVAEILKQNTELDAKYKEAMQRVQAIAEKAIDGASQQKVVVQAAASSDASESKRR
jgi:DNA repair exonuclease SbcCD ATPase subunit